MLAHWAFVGTPPGGRVLNVAWLGGAVFGIPAAMAALEGRLAVRIPGWWAAPLLALLVLSSSRVYEALADRMGRAPVFASVNAERLSRIAAGPPADGGPILLPARPPRLGEPFFLALAHDVAVDPAHWTAAGMAAWFQVPQVARSPELIPIDEVVRRVR